MVAARDDRERLVVHHAEIAIGPDVAPDHHFEHAFAQLRHQPVARIHRDVDRQQRVTRLQRTSASVSRPGDAAMMLPIASRPALPSCSSPAAVQRLHTAADPAEIAEHALAGRVQHGAPDAIEQPLAERALQLGQHLRRGRLREAHLVGRRAQRRAFVHGQQQRDLPRSRFSSCGVESRRSIGIFDYSRLSIHQEFSIYRLIPST